jgi:large subunit ribosomal protein L13
VAKKTISETKSETKKTDTSVAGKAQSKTTSSKAKPKVASLVEKRAQKSQSRARKLAGKTQARVPRALKRAEKSADKSATKGAKSKKLGHAPHSSRITSPKGPIQGLASRTRFASLGNDERKWFVIDATNKLVGRLATEIALILRGKNKASFTPNNDVGDFVVVVNADKVQFKSNKEEVKEYNYHSGYIGGIKTVTAAEMRKRNPTEIIRWAVHGMVPRNPLGRRQMKKLKIYAGPNHPHKAQGPTVMEPRWASVSEK